MGRARSAIAARTDLESLRQAVLAAYGAEAYETERYTDFFDVAQFCRKSCEELGGEVGSDGWYFWKDGDWAIVGDLSLALVKDEASLAAVSAKLGKTVVAMALDLSFDFAHFSVGERGGLIRKLVLEESVILDEGLPLKAERGRHLDDFNEEEAERLWTSYGLPTFEHDPLDADFQCAAVRKS
jgi:hypothetical protein